jgi:anti-sigma B factor antagonist
MEVAVSFLLDMRTARGVIILALSGRLTVGRSGKELREAVRGLCEQGHLRFVLNLEGITYIDSCGLGELVATYVSLRNRGGELSLVGPTERTRRLLNVTKLSTVLSVFDDEARAVETLAADAAGRG